MNCVVVLLSIFCCFLQVRVSIASSLDCSKYANDTEVLRSLPFYVAIDPSDRADYKTFATTYPNKTMILSLNIYNQSLVPPTIFCLQALAEIYIMDSTICDEQSSVCQLSSEIERWSESLSSLNILRTRVTHLPTSIGKLQRLNTVKLWNNDLATLPNTFSSLKLLSSLSIIFNQLKSLPKGFGMLNSLSTIELNNNVNLRSIQSLNGLPNLITISAINCSITSIPINLPKLYFMEMTNNKISNLNGIQTIGSQQDLTKYFLFSLNQIRAVPSEIASVNNLYIFHLDNNQLTNLPSTIFGYKALAVLYIQNNSFTSNVLRQIVNKFKTTNPNMRLVF